MAWNEPGGKRRDPWQGGGGRNNDVDAMLKRVRDRFGGRGPGGGVAFVVLAVIAAWFLLDSWRTIDESERGVVLRLGKFHRVMGAGLNVKWPSPIEQVYVVETTRVRSVSDQLKMLTRDENLVLVDFNVQYQVADPRAYVFGVRDPDATLQQAAESAVRQVIGGARMDTILSGERTSLSRSAEELLQATLDRYGTGITVTELSFQNPRPPPEVKEAFDDAITAREDRQRIENEAQAYASKVIPEARGAAARLVAEAEGDRASTIDRAKGEAERFRLVAEQYRAAPEVTRRRLMIETMQQVLRNSRKVLVEGEGDKLIYLPTEGARGAVDPMVSGALPMLERSPSVQAARGDDAARAADRGRERPSLEERDR